MGEPPTTRKRERLEARVSPEQKALFERAARLQKRSLTDFIIGALHEAAARAIRDHEVLTLTRPSQMRRCAPPTAVTANCSVLARDRTAPVRAIVHRSGDFGLSRLPAAAQRRACACSVSGAIAHLSIHPGPRPAPPGNRGVQGEEGNRNPRVGAEDEQVGVAPEVRQTGPIAPRWASRQR